MYKSFKSGKIVRTFALTLAMGAISMGGMQQLVFAASEAPSQSHTDNHDGHKMMRNPLEDAAQALGMQKDAVRQQLESGKSLSDIASSKGISTEKLKSALISQKSSRIDEAVKSGAMTEDKAKEIKNKLNANIDKMIQHKGMWHARRHATRLLPSQEKLAKKLGITQDELRQKMKSGQSLAEIAQERGLTKAQLIQSIQEDLSPKIEKMVDRKKEKQAN
ncbi:hypothetical protein NV379_04220 [Paenibacillus sp. N1-5-1-14]|uniref:hypothetical protein n=1 Tax=Paenibacillus radicibacter TaxID=2972488 RepID=UPI0021594F58|nr:hypothetical protein [Paenibacillus radicibacter]MCR8641858.1 hypothetical protein [Paenibacillus radicibacter]